MDSDTWLRILQIISAVAGIFIVPVFSMVWTVQGRLSKMEGELKALYRLVEILAERRANKRGGND